VKPGAAVRPVQSNTPIKIAPPQKEGDQTQSHTGAGA
jgi:hypothetical protein